MARRRRTSSGNAGGASGAAQYVKLEQRLVLLAWLNGHFGYEHNRDLLADVKEAAEGFDASGRSYVYHRLEACGDKVKIPLADLARYDDNIRKHLRAMNARRPEPITLRYFHGDRYGKDFRILNLREETTEDKTETLLLRNLSRGAGISLFEERVGPRELCQGPHPVHGSKWRIRLSPNDIRGPAKRHAPDGCSAALHSRR